MALGPINLKRVGLEHSNHIRMGDLREDLRLPGDFLQIGRLFEVGLKKFQDLGAEILVPDSVNLSESTFPDEEENFISAVNDLALDQCPFALRLGHITCAAPHH